jgi:transglutaminase-like putative cysteine protease
MFNADYWNNQQEKTDIIHKEGGKETDVRRYLKYDDCVVKKISDQLKGKTNNETALNMQRWVAKNIRYIKDVNERWKAIPDTLFDMGGDCEDQAILLAQLIICAGIPSYRVRVAAGWVTSTKVIGHAYCIYLADRKSMRGKEWVILDTNFYSDESIECDKKPLLNDGGVDKLYGAIWYSFNNQYAWRH